MLARELEKFDKEVSFLKGYRSVIFSLDRNNENDQRTANFLAESAIFMLFRAQERLIRALFLETCVSHRTWGGQRVISRLKCADWDQAEEILKSNSKFLDWGNPQSTNLRAALVFENGFPINDALAPVHSALVDLLRVRNFIAHDSRDSMTGFEKAARNYLSTGISTIASAGELLLSRKGPKDSYVITKLLEKVGSLSSAYKAL